MTEPDPAGSAPEPAPRLLRCYACGRTVSCTDDDVRAYAGSQWPECCGLKMVLFTPVARPADPRPGD